jgi:hypothetical protein
MGAFQIMHQFHPEEKGFLQLICEGDLSIRNIDDIKKELKSLTGSVEKLELIIRHAIALDFAFLQLMVALIQGFLSTKKIMFQFDFQINPETERIIRHAGLLAVFEHFRDNKSA